MPPPNGAFRTAAIGSGAGAGAAAIVYVLAQAWVTGLEERQANTQRDANIAIRQADAHGLNLDAVEREVSEIRRKLERLESFRAAGPRYTLERGRLLERRVERLEDVFLDAPEPVDNSVDNLSIPPSP